MHAAFQVSDGAGSQPAVAWDGHSFGVAFQDLSNDAGDIVFAVVDEAGNLNQKATITNDANTSTLPSVVATSSGFLVLWQDQDGSGSVVKARQVGADGSPSGSAFEVTSSGQAQARPGGAAASGGVAITWADTSDAFVGLLSGTTMANKTGLDPAEAAAIGANGDKVAVTWGGGGTVGVALLSAPYTNASPIAIGVDGHVPRVSAGESGGFMLAWEDWRTGADSPSVYATSVGSDGNVATPVLVQSEGTGANYPDIAFSGDHAAVVYYQFRDGPPAVFLTQLNSDLSRAGADLEVSTGAPQGSKYARIAWSGSVYGVVFADVDGPAKMALVGCN